MSQSPPSPELKAHAPPTLGPGASQALGQHLAEDTWPGVRPAHWVTALVHTCSAGTPAAAVALGGVLLSPLLPHHMHVCLAERRCLPFLLSSQVACWTN